jgi:hypothetical protein
MLCYIDLPERRGMFEEIFTGKSTQPTAKRDSVMQLRFRACLPRFTLVNSRTRINPEGGHLAGRLRHEHFLPIPERERLRSLTGALDHHVTAFNGRSLERVQHLQHVHSQLAAGPVPAISTNGCGHVKQANNAIIGDLGSVIEAAIGLAERVCGDVEWRPIAIAFRNHRLAAEKIGIGYQHAAFRPVDFEGYTGMFPNVPGGGDSHAGTVGEGEHTIDGGGNFDFDD